MRSILILYLSSRKNQDFRCAIISFFSCHCLKLVYVSETQLPISLPSVDNKRLKIIHLIVERIIINHKSRFNASSAVSNTDGVVDLCVTSVADEHRSFIRNQLAFVLCVYIVVKYYSRSLCLLPCESFVRISASIEYNQLSFCVISIFYLCKY